MKQKIISLQNLFDFIENSGRFSIFDKDEDSFIIGAPNNTTWQIQFEVDDDIDEIIYKTIDQLEEFDVDDRFIELWDKDYSPSQFLRMLQEDEARFQELAGKLENVLF